MTRLRLRAILAVARRDAHFLLSYRSTFVTRPLGLVFSLALFYFVSRLVIVSRVGSADAYFAFVAVGIVIFGVVSSSLLAPARVRDELVAGTYERLELSPLGSTAATVGMIVTPFLNAAALSTFTLLIACTVFGMDVRWSTAALAIPVGILGALAFAPFALLFCAVTLAYKQAPGQGAILPALSLVGGLYFPIDVLPEWIRWLSFVQPLTPTVDLMRNVLVGLPIPGDATVDVLRLVGFAVVGLPVGLVGLVAANRHGRRRGTLLES
jgi:ABC-2 type transport system permease protein